MWRFWTTEESLARLDKANDNLPSLWAVAGRLTVHDGGLLDYDLIYEDIGTDGDDFAIHAVHVDEFSMWPVLNKVRELTGLDPEEGEITAYKNTYDRMTPGLNEVMAMVKTERFNHHGNPVAEWCFDSVEVRRANYNVDLIRPDKPDRSRAGYRIDAVSTAAMAANAALLNADDDGATYRSAHEDRGLTFARLDYFASRSPDDRFNGSFYSDFFANFTDFTA